MACLGPLIVLTVVDTATFSNGTRVVAYTRSPKLFFIPSSVLLSSLCRSRQLQHRGTPAGDGAMLVIGVRDLTACNCNCKLVLEVGCFNCGVAAARDQHTEVMV